MGHSQLGPHHILRWTSKFTRRLVGSGLGRGASALSEIARHVAPLRGIYSPFLGAPPVMVGMEERGSHFVRLRNETMVSEKYSMRRCLRFQQSLEDGDLDNVYWLPGLADPADGVAEDMSDMIPLPRLLGPGAFHSGMLRPFWVVPLVNKRSARFGGRRRKLYFRVRVFPCLSLLGNSLFSAWVLPEPPVSFV